MPNKQSKAAFVRAHPGVPAKGVVRLARAVGIALSTNYVYLVRSADKRKGRGTARRVGRPSKGTRAEDLLKACAADLGIPLALQILRTEQERIRRMLA